MMYSLLFDAALATKHCSKLCITEWGTATNANLRHIA